MSIIYSEIACRTIGALCYLLYICAMDAPARSCFTYVSSQAPLWPFEVRSVGLGKTTFPYPCHRPKGADFFIVFWTVEGQGYLKTPGRICTLNPKSLFVLPPGVEHEYGPGKAPGFWEAQWFTFRGLAAETMAKSMALDRLRVLEDPSGSCPSLEPLYSVLKTSGLHGQIESARIGLGLLYEIAARMDREKYGKPGTRFGQVAQWAQEHLDSGMTPVDVADHARMSRSHFSRAFKADQGISPKRFLAQARMERAKELLLTTSLSVKEVADKAGFCDSAHFCRRFRFHCGLNPTEFRKTAPI